MHCWFTNFDETPVLEFGGYRDFWREGREGWKKRGRREMLGRDWERGEGGDIWREEINSGMKAQIKREGKSIWSRR